ncbi:MAG TPA: hypothetical protein VEQ65_06700 [Opitutus sp.]|nr:hypothetical protein [Opitutus sp.]
MALWEYKVISSGKGGFATPALLEKFLNDLGREEWEIVEFRTPADNPLAFSGLARRSTQRDWTLEDAAAAAATAEAEKLRAEFAAKFQAATSPTATAEEKAASFLEEKVSPDDGFRKPVDTSRDDDPDAPEDDNAEKDEWDQLAEEDELPSFFDALKPHMRRNQRGPGMSVGTDYLAKKWGLDEGDIKGALVECGLQIPADENAKPVYVEYDGDLYWVNINRRGEVWINTREKPRPVFRVVQATKVEATEETKPEPRSEERQKPAEQERSARSEARPAREGAKPAEAPASAPNGDSASPAGPLPQGPELLAKIRPLMRRNRRGPGGSGSASFLARALKCSEADLVNGFAALGLVVPANPADKPVDVEIAGDIWWLNQDSRGGLWINGREKRDRDAKPGADTSSGETAGAETANPAATEKLTSAPTELPLEPASTAAPAAPVTAEPANVFAAVRLLLKETKTGAVAGKLDRVAGELGKSVDDLTAALVGVGLKVPEKSREKPVFVEHSGEIFWFNRNAKGELWVNAKASKFADSGSGGDADAGAEGAEKKSSRRGGRSRGRGAKSESEASPEPAEPGASS